MKLQFAQRVRELRLEKNLTQTQLSTELNGQITQQAIDLWEKGLRIPKADAIILLANYFNVTTDYLLGRTDY